MREHICFGSRTITIGQIRWQLTSGWEEFEAACSRHGGSGSRERGIPTFNQLSPFPFLIYSQFQAHVMELLTFRAGFLPPQLVPPGKSVSDEPTGINALGVSLFLNYNFSLFLRIS